uniref:Myb-like domain-containing protein n=1 Tax=Oryza punctata TaxID=4537 RepID=A0A0E0K7T6_ORYPU
MQQQPGMPPFSAAGGEGAPSPISSRPPPEQAAEEQQLNGSSLEHDGLGGDEGDRGGSSAGNRWPRQETLALLKIRSEMDAAFREAALKGPLWEEVSRKLAEMGYRRSAKKCREKFENVDNTPSGSAVCARMSSKLKALVPFVMAMATVAELAAGKTYTIRWAVSGNSASGVHEHELLVGETAEEGGKRKRRSGGGGGGGGKAMRMFEGLMRQVMERQEAMQQRLLEAIERRDQERMIREEAWRRQEVARLAREQDALAQERAIAASRDAAVISFIQRVTGQSIAVPPPPLQPTPVASAAPPPQHQHHQQTPQPIQLQHHIMPMTPQPQPQPQLQPQPQSKEANTVRAPPPEQHDTAASGGGASSSRWPKAEVHALIQLRTEMETRYQDSGPKGPLWEDISAGMRRLGYSRSSKRCKEKWENINKYFKKVKESNKKRPEDSKTCPYYHQLDALYRSKANAAASPAPATTTVLAPVPLSQTPPPHVDHGSSNGNGNGWASANNGGGSSGGMQTKASNGTATAGGGGFPVVSVAGDGGGGNGNGVAATTDNKGSKQEPVAKETAPEQRQPQPLAMNHNYGNDRMADDMDSDSMDDDDDDDEFDDDEEDDDIGGGKMHVQYETSHFQRPQLQNQNVVVGRPNASGGGGPPTAPAGPPPPAATSGTSFLACVQ